MSEEVGSYVAKTKLPELLRRVAEGESFTITNHGKPVADIVPSARKRRERAKVSIRNLLAMSRSVVSDEKLREFREEGRK